MSQSASEPDLQTPSAIAPTDPTEWAYRIQSSLERSVEAILETGRLLQAAKDDLPHGQFTFTLELVGLSPCRAQILLSVAANEAIAEANAKRISHSLPPSIGTLYELSRLEPDVLHDALGFGNIHAGITRQQAKAFAQQVGRPHPQGSPDLPVGMFRTIVADPPWRYDNEGTRASANSHYDTMSMEELCALEVPAADDCHLWLWVTNPFMREGFEVLDAWGFEYRTTLTWCKPQIGLGNYLRSAIEHVLFAIRGSLPIERHDVLTFFTANR